MDHWTANCKIRSISDIDKFLGNFRTLFAYNLGKIENRPIPGAFKRHDHITGELEVRASAGEFAAQIKNFIAEVNESGSKNH